MPDPVRVAVVPAAEPEVLAAVRAGGGELVEPAAADALVWTDPLDHSGLARALGDSPARWVQLPFAGVERFVAAGVVDAGHVWTCAKGIYGPTTAEHALGLTLALARRVHVHARARSWRRRTGEEPERTLAGSTVVVVGTGGIGAALARMLEPLRARVVGVNRSGSPLAGAERTVTVAELPDVVAQADVVALAAALTPETRDLVDAALLDRMRPDALLVNVARGGLVDTAALVEALRSRAIAGAALDVTEPEPLPDDHPLWELPTALVTPHVANTWPMALPELAALVRRNVERFARGEPLEGLVDPEAGY